MSKSKSNRGYRSKVKPGKKEFAQHIRKNPTPSEAELWQRLRRKQLEHKFRRRAILYGWILDFWCPAKKLAIELDHASDSKRVNEHARRDSILAHHGIRVLRISASRVFNELDEVVREIKETLNNSFP
jgi:very-short-patch-repair endonuclease